ncbi:hypothetical protein JKP88DRAFT_352770 [Tribonema minus]|uniref:Uncharacterized protein n=1 Tax=Tribonema minus TaxID=303371 RepID=A0A835ZJK1_9STRA|nr:hypothetical protein JKP88DRAFT_352770 [Tribonema minus]
MKLGRIGGWLLNDALAGWRQGADAARCVDLEYEGVHHSAAHELRGAGRVAMLSRLASQQCKAVAAAPAAQQAGRRALSALLSLEQEFPGSPEASPSALPTPVSKVSTLPNGVKVASLETGDKAASFSLVVNAGSRDETLPQTGATLLLSRLAYKSTAERSSLRLNRDLQDAGVIYGCVGGREKTIYTAQCLPDAAPAALSAIAETVLSPRMSPWEVSDIKRRGDNAQPRTAPAVNPRSDARLSQAVAWSKMVAKIDLVEHAASPAAMLLEAVHAAAFDPASPLGHPFFAPCELDAPAVAALAAARSAPASLTLAALAAARTAPASLTLAEGALDFSHSGVPMWPRAAKAASRPCVGISHEDLLEAATELFGGGAATAGAGAANAAPARASKFVGGEHRVHTKSGAVTHVALAFAGPAAGDKDAPAFQVLAALLDARAHDAIHPTAHTLTATYGDAGVFALAAADAADASAALAASLARAVAAAAKAAPPATELAAAVALARVRALAAAAAPAGAAAALAARATSGAAAGVDGVTGEAVRAAAAKLAKGPMALAAVGDMRAVPRLDTIKGLL